MSCGFSIVKTARDILRLPGVRWNTGLQTHFSECCRLSLRLETCGTVLRTAAVELADAEHRAHDSALDRRFLLTRQSIRALLNFALSVNPNSPPNIIFDHDHNYRF